MRQLQTEETESKLKKDFDRICFESQLLHRSPHSQLELLCLPLLGPHAPSHDLVSIFLALAKTLAVSMAVILLLRGVEIRRSFG
jgi:hypothetical protein